MVMLSLLCAMFFIPAIPGGCYEVRGNGEMFPLNGPSWSLFFEYIGNILYALFIRRMSTKALTVLVVLLGAGLASFAIFNVSGYGSIGVGWTLDSVNFLGGSLRMLFPFSMGMLLSRHFKPIKIKGAFWICAAVLIALFFVPYIKGTDPLCINGFYEAFCIIVAFPVLVWLGASGTTTDDTSTKICKFLGDISYPLYVVHYPFMYLFYAWLIKNKLYTFGETWQVALCVFVWNIIVAYLCLRLYDIPVRKYLARILNTKTRK
jgi:peptidoglycan/LPS O-acetylase OafA/YrhL